MKKNEKFDTAERLIITECILGTDSRLNSKLFLQFFGSKFFIFLFRID